MQFMDSGVSVVKSVSTSATAVNAGVFTMKSVCTEVTAVNAGVSAVKSSSMIIIVNAMCRVS